MLAVKSESVYLGLIYEYLFENVAWKTMAILYGP